MSQADNAPSQTNSSDYFGDDDPLFLEALRTVVLPGESKEEEESENTVVVVPSQQHQVAVKRLRNEKEETEASKPSIAHKSVDVPGDDTYGASRFGDWGTYMRRKRAKLQIQNAEMQGSASQRIFEGLSIHINGWTQPSVQDLRKYIVEHGGVFQPYLDRKSLVTHIITCSLTPAKIREFKHMKVVRPEWITDSISAKTLLPWVAYKYVPDERVEDTQGTKSKQKTLLGMATGAAGATNSSTGEGSSGAGSVRQLSDSSRTKSTLSKPTTDPLYTTDPVTRAAAARVPGYASSKSNPLAERVMADPEWRKAHTSVAPDFIEGFYKNSRLHHLSTWRSELKGLVQQAQERAEADMGDNDSLLPEIEKTIFTGPSHENSGVSMKGAELPLRSPSRWKGKTKAVDGEERVVMHCDFDCFFVSAGLIDRPEMKGKPVVVCHSQGKTGGASSTSEIASSNYEARAFGIRNGMSLQQARKLCPAIQTIPYEFERYKQLSLKFYTILMSHADDLQAVSVDEALIDVTSTILQLRSRERYISSCADPVKDFAEALRAQIRNATECEVSIGISHNILLARLATRRAKPAGSFHLTPHLATDFLAPLDIGDLHGFGYSTKQKALEKLGVTNLGELTKKSKSALCEALGKTTGQNLYNALRGIDEKPLESDKPRKSVSCEINYGIRFESNDQAQAFICQMATEVARRLDASGLVGRSITLKIMKRDPMAPVEPPKFLGHGICDVFNKQAPLPDQRGRATSDEHVIAETAWRLLKTFDFDPADLRGIGIQVQKLEFATASSHVSSGQAQLLFKPLSASEMAETSLRGQNDPVLVVRPPSQENVRPTERKALPNSSIADLPSFSQVDMMVFDALPKDVRAELEGEYARRSASPAVGHAMPDVANMSSLKAPVPHAGPQGKIAAKSTNFKRIAQALAPRSAASISPRKSTLFRTRQAGSSSNKTSDVNLVALGIDPTVFAMLPVNIQREQLVRARLLKNQGSIPEAPTVRKILKPRKPKPVPPHLLWRAPPPKARYHSPPMLRQRAGDCGEKIAFKKTDDIQCMVEKWVTGHQHWAPKAKDVEYFTRYLVQSVDSARAGDVGVDRAVAVLKWWLVLLRRIWPACEMVEESTVGPPATQTDPVGDAWWDAFRTVKKEMDVVVRRKFGGCLSLK